MPEYRQPNGAHSASAWFWHLELENAGDTVQALDVIYAQDLALAHYGAVRLNESYVSQYVDHTPLSHPERGLVLGSRQNHSMGGRNPWCVIGARSKKRFLSRSSSNIFRCPIPRAIT